MAVETKFYNLDTDGTLSSNSDLYIASEKAVKSYVDDAVNTKQDTLVSGTNIKTVNGSSILGSGDLTVSASYTAGTGIDITNNTISTIAMVITDYTV